MNALNPVPPKSHLPSWLLPQDTTPWDMFLEQVTRVEPHLGSLGRWAVSYTHLDVYKRQIKTLVQSSARLHRLSPACAR